MSAAGRQKKHWAVALITLACILADAVFFVAVGGALKWLAGILPASGWIVIALLAVAAVGVVQTLRQTRSLCRPSATTAH